MTTLSKFYSYYHAFEILGVSGSLLGTQERAIGWAGATELKRSICLISDVLGGTPGFCNIRFSVHLLKIISARSLSPLHSQVLETISCLQCSDGDRKGPTLGRCLGSYRTSVLVLANVLPALASSPPVRQAVLCI